MSKFELFLIETVKECKSKADFCRAMDLLPEGENYRKIDYYIKKYNLDTSHFTNEPWNKGKCFKYSKKSLEELLVKNSEHTNQNLLKQRLFKTGLKTDVCEICGHEGHNELHHINGDSTDNRLENLQILCPNCHAQTDNYRGKKSSIGRRHKTPEELILSEEEAKKREEKRRESRRIPKDQWQKTILEDKICPICGKTFHPSSLTQKYCSIECYRSDPFASGKRPSVIELLEKLKEYQGNFTKVGEFYNVTDNAVRKWCKFYKIDYHSNTYKQIT